MERRLVKCCENLKVRYDNTVRDAYNRVVQFEYGDDRNDATYIIRSKPLNVPLRKAEMSMPSADYEALKAMGAALSAYSDFTTVIGSSIDFVFLVDKVKKLSRKQWSVRTPAEHWSIV